MAAVATAKQISASGAICAMPAKLWGVSLTAAAAAATLTIYDSAAGSGTIIEQVSCPANTTQWLGFSVPTAANTAIYAVITGTSATAIVRFELC